MPHSRSAPMVTALVAVSLIAAGCGDDSTTRPSTAVTSDVESVSSSTSASPSASTTTTTTVPDPRDGRPFTVTTTQLTFVDNSRATPAATGTAELADRTLDVWLYLPDTGGPAPLVVFSHGMAGHPRKFEDLHTAWAEAGYAVAAPTFPLSNDSVEGSFTNVHDVPNQPGDVSFVLDELLARSTDDTSDLAGRFDPASLGASGLSAGGFTTYAAAVNRNTRDARFSAAVVMAGLLGEDSAAGPFVASDDMPVLVFQGEVDPLVSVSDAETAYAALKPHRYFVVLLGGGHAGPFEDVGEGIEPKVPGHDELIRAATIAFWDHYLLDIPEAADELLLAADQDDLTTFAYDVG